MNSRQFQQHQWTRRQAILSGVSLAALPWLGQQSKATAGFSHRFADNPFTLGVASGDPSSDGVVLWTRLA
ncbi:MAG: alkaline phosphatase, partial [Planctomycetaceae bacterium]